MNKCKLFVIAVLCSFRVFSDEWEVPAFAIGPRIGFSGSAATPQEACSDRDVLGRRFIFREGSDDGYTRTGARSITFDHIIGVCVDYMLTEEGWVENPGGPATNASFNLRHFWDTACPTSKPQTNTSQYDFPSFGEMMDGYYCAVPRNEDCTRVSNPVSFATGSKYQEETDYISEGQFPLKFVRYYNSAQSAGATRFASTRSFLNLTSWKYSYSSVLAIHGGSTKAYMLEDSGRIVYFEKQLGLWKNANSTGAQLHSHANGWNVVDSKGVTHLFDQTGVLVGRKDSQGNVQSISRVDGNIVVTNWNGEVLTIVLDQDRPIRLIDSEGNETRYTFTARSQTQPIGDLFASVAYPDESIKTYEYDFENSNHLLTGIRVDGVLVSSWEYDAEGRAIVSEKAGGVDRTELDYAHFDDASDPRVLVTNPLGKQTTYHFDVINNRYRTTFVEGHASENCAASSKSSTFDANGYVASQTDWRGVVTTFLRNDRGLVTSRTEAVGTPNERVVLTEWHTDFPLKTKITEAQTLTHFTYDVNGRLLKKTIAPRATP